MDAKNVSLISNPLTNAAALASNLQQLRENLVNSGLSAQTNGNALMSAFGINPTLPLPLGLWDNSLLNAAMYMDPSNSLFNLKQNIDQLNGGLNQNGLNLMKKPEDLSLVKQELRESKSPITNSSMSPINQNGQPISNNKRARTNETLFGNGSASSLNGLNSNLLSKELAYLEQGKSFPCPECHKTFSTEVDLKAHLLRHVMQHPYSCPTCGKGFKYEHTLDFHIKSQHGGVEAPAPKLNPKGSSKKNGSASNRKEMNGNSNGDNVSLHKFGRLSMAKAAAAQLATNSSAFDQFELEDLNNNNIPANHLVNSAKSLTRTSSPAAQSMSTSPNSFDSFVQVKEEKVLILMLEGINPLNDQSYTLYKCNLCGFAFPTLGPVTEHVQRQHTKQMQHTCEKCGANFKWQNELLLHEQLHKAMEQVPTSNASFKSMLMTPLLQPNLMLMNQYLNSQQLQLDKNNNANGNGSLLLANGLCNPNSSSSAGSSLAGELPSPPQTLQPRQSLTSPTTFDNSNELQGLNLSKSARKDSESSSQESLALRKPSKLMLKELRSEEIDELSKNIAVVKEHSKGDLGEIEETAPGQFKCRFCEKTFDRIFSVHRHERVHTGFKPCVCKVCGRGFSEKRNLRHHIIRFHSDGSGRELLRRVRKDKSGSLENGEARRQLKAMEMNVDGHLLSNHASDEDPSIAGDENVCNADEMSSSGLFESRAANQMATNPNGEEHTDEELMDTVGDEEHPLETLPRTQSNESCSASSAGSTSGASTSSSSRRRKSVPCKKANHEELNGDAGDETEEEMKFDALSCKSEASSDAPKADYDDLGSNHSGEPIESALTKKETFFDNRITV